MALRTVTLQGKYQTLKGEPATGTVSFELSGPLLDSAGNVIYPKLKRVEPLDSEGAFSVVLPATKGDVSTAPQGLTYKINEAISPGLAHVYAIELDADLGTEQQLADIAPATNVAVQTYALVSTLAAHTAASENVHGIADTSQLATLADVAANVPEWGNVSGTLSAQTDLATALAGKADTSSFANVNRIPVLTVAASTASAKERALADYACDGTADDVQIQAAIDALTDTGGTVQLSAGTFNLSSTLNRILLASNITLRGVGSGTLVQSPDVTTPPTIQTAGATGTAANNVTIRDLQIAHHINNNVGSVAGITIVNGTNILVENVHIHDTNDMPIYIGRGADTVMVRNCYIHDYGNTSGVNGRYAIEVDGTDSGDGVAAPARVSVIGCHIWNGWNGISVSSNNRVVTDVTFIGNHINIGGASAIFGIVVGVGNGASSFASNVVIANNIVTQQAGKSGTGIYVQSARHAVISGNVIHDINVGLFLFQQNAIQDTLITQNAITGCNVGFQAGGATVLTNTMIDGLLLSGNNTPINDVRTSKTGLVIRGIVGQKISENGGTAIITSAATSVTVTHGVYGTPGVVQVTPTASLGSAAKYWVSAIGATTFTINVDAAPGASVTFSWAARMYA